MLRPAATVAPRLARRFGIEAVLVGVMVALAAGAFVRVLDGPALLFAGTVVVGGSIAIGNVLLPPLIKRDFPDRSGLMMGVYTMAVSGAAAVAAGLAVPLADAAGSGWRGALGAWAVPAAVAALAWLPRMRGHTRPPATPRSGRSLLRDPLAWQITVFFGLQSLSFYAVLAWLPSMYRDFGASPAVAGFLLSVSGSADPGVARGADAGEPGGPPDRVRRLGTASIGAGLAGVLLAPMAAPYLWVGLIGAGQGACFALGLNLFVLRTRRVADTARVSAMAQSIGYTLCAAGPLVGLLHDATGSWTVPLVLLLALLVPQLACGALAGAPAPSGPGRPGYPGAAAGQAGKACSSRGVEQRGLQPGPGRQDAVRGPGGDEELVPVPPHPLGHLVGGPG